MTYQYYTKTFKDIPKPFAFIDMDVLNENTIQLLQRAGDKPIRLATKSIRCKAILAHLLERSPQIQGLMCYDLLEAKWLSEQGFDDILIGYPFCHAPHIEAIAHEVKKGKRIVLMTDLPEHLDIIQRVGEQLGVKLPVCVDVDVSTQIGKRHFGVHRSSLRTAEDVEKYLAHLSSCSHVKLVGMMAYEAQVAGTIDNVPGRRFRNMKMRRLKKRAIPEIAEKRAAISELIRTAGFDLEFVNGGGTGSLESTTKEEAVTEVTIGSGFYSPQLFDYYQSFRHLPAAWYAIEVTRNPQPNLYTCTGGGYVASGAFGREKLPAPYLPEGAKLIKLEMAGEVQTPLVYEGVETLKLGGPVFMRHAKAGELCEHFDELYLVKTGGIIDKVKTYRGVGVLGY